jgi:hypothetical protein
MDEKKFKKTCVLVDTNIWIKTVLLSSTLGSRLLYNLNLEGNKIILPEIIEDEVKKNIKKNARDASRKIERGIRDLRTIIGSAKSYGLPTEDIIESAIQARFDKLNPLIERIPFKIEHAKNALNRVNEKIPPSSRKTQQFKDSVIWETVLEIGKKYDVILITQDGDFFENKDRSILNKILSKECIDIDINVNIFSDLSDYLEGIQGKAQKIDYNKISDYIFKQIKNEVQAYVTEKGFRLDDIKDSKISAFITEDHNILALKFELNVNMTDIDSTYENIRLNPQVIISGDSNYLISEDKTIDTLLWSIELIWDGEGGNDPRNKMGFARLNANLFGEPSVPYRIRQELM